MISRYEAIMDGVPLSSVCENLLIRDIAHGSAGLGNQAISFAKRDGLYIADRTKQKATVTITFTLRLYDITERQRACQAVASWALNGKTLETNDRPGQRLRCVCDEPPVIQSALRWLDTISMTFSGYIVPYWEESAPSTLTLTGSSATGTLFVPGNADHTFAECTVTPAATITSFRIDVGDTFINLTGISVSTTQTLKISYDDDMNLMIKRGTTSYLNKRTSASSDDLVAKCGKNNTVTVTASASVTAVIKARGLWI